MPTPNTQFYVVGGTVNPDSPSYVVRQADQELFDRAMAGDYCYVLTSRQMGKSSLMARTAQRLSEAGIHTAIVDLTLIGNKSDTEQWYYGIAHRILRELVLRDVNLTEWWQARSSLSAMQRLTEFFSDLLLERIAGQIVIFMDEIDSTISLPFTDDFFAAIRACHNARGTEPAYNRLSFVLLGVASPSDLVKDRTRTPFNVGHRIELTDFTAEEASPLAAGLSANEQAGQQILGRILEWTGGHPYLTQKLCDAMQSRDPEVTAKTDGDVNSLVEQNFLTQTASREDSNLNFVRDWLKGDERLVVEVLKLYRRIRRGKVVPDAPLSPVQNHLKLSGVVTLHPNRTLHVRNRIYERVFTSEWAKKAIPVDWNRRLIVASAAMLLLSIGFWFLIWNPRQYIAPIRDAINDYPGAAHRSLRRFPWYTGTADELLAQFWERHVLRNARDGRDVILLERLQALAAKPSELRRKEAALLIGGDYRNLILTLRHGADVSAVAFSPDGKRLLTGSRNGTAQMWDAQTGQQIGEPLLHNDSIPAVAFSPDGKRVLTGCGDGTAQMWNVQTSRQIGEPLRHGAVVSAVAFSSDGKRVLTGCGDGTVRMWDVQTSRQIGKPLLQGSEVFAVAFGPDGKRLLIGSRNPLDEGTVWVRDTQTGQQIGEPLRHGSDVYAMAFSPDSKRVLTGSIDGTARMWDAQTGQQIGELLHHSDSVFAVAFSPNGKRVLTGSSDDTARMWDAQTDLRICEPLRPGTAISAVAFSPDGKRLLTGSKDGMARMWDTLTGQQIGQSLRHGRSVSTVAFSPDGRRALTGGYDGIARLWEVGTNHQIGENLLHSGSVTTVAFSPDSNRMLTGSDDGTARIWDAHSGHQIGEPLRHSDSVSAVALSPDSDRVLTGSNDGTTRMWDAQTGQQIGEPLRHSASVSAMAFSSDDKRVLTGSRDGTVRMWNAQSDQLIGETLDYGSEVIAVAFSPDGKRALAQTSKWLYLSDVAGNGLILKASRFFSRVWEGGYRFHDDRGDRLKVIVLGVGGSLKIETMRFDLPEAPPLLGDPANLLQDWQKKLGLRFDADQNQKLVPIYPVETQGGAPFDPNSVRTFVGYVPVYDVRTERSNDGYLRILITGETPTRGWRLYTHHEITDNNTLEVRLRGFPPASFGYRQVSHPSTPTIIIQDLNRTITRLVVHGSNGSRTVPLAPY